MKFGPKLYAYRYYFCHLVRRVCAVPYMLTVPRVRCVAPEKLITQVRMPARASGPTSRRTYGSYCTDPTRYRYVRYLLHILVYQYFGEAGLSLLSAQTSLAEAH